MPLVVGETICFIDTSTTKPDGKKEGAKEDIKKEAPAKKDVFPSEKKQNYAIGVPSPAAKKNPC